jgi:hypothetical protein
MTRKSTKSQSVVDRLLEQQRQYQDWLERLDKEAAGAAPSHVAQRVRADYAARLNEVTQELSEHQDGVRQALAEAEVRSEGLTKQHADRTDELAEARLRRQVGEFDEEQYEEIATRCKSALSELAKELATVERDIDRYEEILSLIKGVSGKRPAPASDVPPEPVPAAPAAGEARGRPFDAGPTRVSAPQMDLDELAFLRSLSERGVVPKTDARVEPPKTQPAKPEPPAAQPATPEPPKSEPLRVEAVRTEPPASEPRKAERPQAPAPPRAPTAGAAEAKDVRPPERRETEGGSKTLVCTECGTKNLPSEWYCEKCGAELAPY